MSGKDDSGCDNSSYAWLVYMPAGYVFGYNKTNTSYVRAVSPAVPSPSATTPTGYGIPFSDIIEAWIECEANKRRSNSCTKFRWHADRELLGIWKSINAGQYEPRVSMCFMVHHPVLREVWAAAFRDRVVHHWEYILFGPVMERFFIDVGDRSMNCRKGYGSLRAVRTFEAMLYDYTEGYTCEDCWIVGGDFANFFMSIDKELLWAAVERLLLMRYHGEHKEALLKTMHTTIMHRCQDNYWRRSREEEWEGLPRRKSLFYMNGLAIGHLPNQILANYLGALFTYHMVMELGVEGFIIFVDDWRCLVRSAEEGRALLKHVKEWLWRELHIELHPDKVYLQHFRKGTKMVGAVVKPGRTYVSNRTRGQFISRMKSLNSRAAKEETRLGMLSELRSTVNSYMGLMKHYNSYKIRLRIAEEHILPVWGKYVYFIKEFSICRIRKEYDPAHTLRRKLKSHAFAANFIRPKFATEETQG